MADLFRDPERLRSELGQRQQEGSPTRTAAEQELSGLRTRLAAIPREQDRLLGAFAKGHVPEDALGRQMDGLQKERLAAQKRVADLERELAALAVSAKQEADAVEYAASVAAGLDALDDDGRKRFLQDMVREVRTDGVLQAGPYYMAVPGATAQAAGVLSHCIRPVRVGANPYCRTQSSGKRRSASTGTWLAKCGTATAGISRYRRWDVILCRCRCCVSHPIQASRTASDLAAAANSRSPNTRGLPVASSQIQYFCCAPNARRKPSG